MGQLAEGSFEELEALFAIDRLAHRGGDAPWVGSPSVTRMMLSGRGVSCVSDRERILETRAVARHVLAQLRDHVIERGPSLPTATCRRSARSWASPVC